MGVRKVGGLFLAGWLCCVASLAHAQTKLETDFAIFTSWLNGSYDNAAQVYREIEDNLPMDQRHSRYHMVYIPIAAPAVKGQLYAIKNYGADGIRGPLTRLSLHRFFPDSSENAIVQEFLFLKDPDRFEGAANNPGLLRNLTEEDFDVNIRCRMYWKQVRERFEGSTKPGRCITDSFTEGKILVEGDGVLTATQLWRYDRNYTLDGIPLAEREDGQHEKFVKARQFLCEERRGSEVPVSHSMHDQADTLKDRRRMINLRRLYGQTPDDPGALILEATFQGKERVWMSASAPVNSKYIAMSFDDWTMNCALNP